MKMIKLLPYSFFLFASTTHADNTKLINQSFASDDFEKLKLELTVGQLDIEVWDEDRVEVSIELRAERSWLTLRRRNLDGIELSVEENGDELYLGIDEKKLEQEWSLKVPAKLAMEIEMGVGSVDINGLQNSLALELEVGEVSINTVDVDFRTIEASVGVGDAALRGFGPSAENERSFVSADAYYEGEGEYQIKVELGVGEVSIRR
jgi:hypothetical protein